MPQGLPNWSGWGGLNRVLEHEQYAMQERRPPPPAYMIPPSRPDTGVPPIGASMPMQPTVNFQQKFEDGSSFMPADIQPVQFRHTYSPPIMVPANPAQDLKRRTAVEYNLTPEAQRDLYNTPSRVYYTQEPYHEDDRFGDYTHPSPERNIAINAWGLSGGQEVPTMMHEFAHKRYFEGDPNVRADWDTSGFGDRPIGPVEAYAYQAEVPLELTPEQRERFYPGMWRQEGWR